MKALWNSADHRGLNDHIGPYQPGGTGYEEWMKVGWGPTVAKIPK